MWIAVFGDLRDELGHGQLDLEFDDVGEGMELHIPACIIQVSPLCTNGDAYGDNLHEGIVQAHHRNDEDVHGE